MKLSFIIPCFNHGKYIFEAVESISEIQNINYEIIIINDGSTDENTLIQLKLLKERGITVVDQKNCGPASARNEGIERATGEYVMPLDADNKIKPVYIYKAVKVLDEGKFDIVYANPIFIGDPKQNRNFKTRPFNFEELLLSNYIDTCALFRRKMWDELAGYDELLPFHGQEDWEFWVHAHTKNFKFFYIDEPLFYYRVVENSVSDNLRDEMQAENHQYILKKHFAILYITILNNYKLGLTYKKDLNNPFRSTLKYLRRSLLKIKN